LTSSFVVAAATVPDLQIVPTDHTIYSPPNIGIPEQPEQSEGEEESEQEEE
jgi:hypothetical protein